MLDRKAIFRKFEEGLILAGGSGPLGLAVSGGGDSTALLALAHDWAAETGRPLAVVTVDHGLRAESAAEARAVAALCVGLGLPHETLPWDGWDGRGNLQAAARVARKALIGKWARRHGIRAVATGHTADDQAETFLMRLARGSGVAGLGAMAEVAPEADLVWLRPLLHERRAALREFLRVRGRDWIEDPSNDDPAFDRVRARQMLETLTPLGLSVERLVQTARHMRAARGVLDAAERALARDILEISGSGEARFDAAALAEAPEATAGQFLADLLAAIGGGAYPPRLDAVERLAARLASGSEGGSSLHGCIIRRLGTQVTLRREPARCTEVVPAANGALWDRRWRLHSLSEIRPGLSIGPLGLRGAASLEQRRPPAPAEVLATTPALRYDDELVAAPAAGLANGWSAEFELADRRRMWVLMPR